MPVYFDIAGLHRETPIRRALLALAAVVGLSSMGIANAEVFRYKENGSVTYGDTAPMNGGDDGHSVLNSQGVVLQQVRSREERRADRKAEQEAMAIRIRDKTLLRTFTEEQDLIRTRDDRLGLADGQLDRLNDRVRIAKESLVNTDQRIRSAERSNGAGNAPPELYADMDRAKKKIADTWALVDTKSTERKAVATKFDEDLARYRWLKSGAASKY